MPRVRFIGAVRPARWDAGKKAKDPGYPGFAPDRGAALSDWVNVRADEVQSSLAQTPRERLRVFNAFRDAILRYREARPEQREGAEKPLRPWNNQFVQEILEVVAGRLRKLPVRAGVAQRAKSAVLYR